MTIQLANLVKTPCISWDPFDVIFAYPLGIPVTVCMPVVAPIMKVENCKKFGATVIIHGANIGESRDKALVIGKEKGFMYVNG